VRIQLATYAGRRDDCLYFPDHAFSEIPEVVCVMGVKSGSKRLAGGRLVEAPEDTDAVTTGPALFRALAPTGEQPDELAADFEGARLRDWFVHGRGIWLPIWAEVSAQLAAVAAAAVSFATTTVPLGVALLLLVLVSVAALLSAVTKTRTALKVG
jgi:hypothetical protein